MKDLKLNNSKILLLCTTDNMIWQFLIPHIQDLTAYGAKVDCVCSKTGFWFEELQNTFNFNMIEIDMKRKPINLTNYKAYKAIKKLYKQNKYDLIYCQQPTGGFLGRFVGKKYHIPVIYTAHGFFFFKGNSKLKNLIFKSAEKYMARYTDILITMNDEDFEASAKWKANEKYKINGIGLDLAKYSEEKFDKESFRKQLGIDENEKVLLSVSEFIPRKNYKTMLECVAQISKKRRDFKYILCGTGAELENMKSLTKELNIQDLTLFLGYRKDIDKIMQVSDIFYHQSFHEGLTMGIIEAMHFALPVVSSNVRGNKDLIADEKGGFLTEPLDMASQIEAIEKLMDDKDLCQKMGSYNKEKSENYSLETVKKQLKNIYKENGLI